MSTPVTTHQPASAQHMKESGPQPALGGTGGSFAPPHHTKEFLRRKEELKGKYKAMNSSIRQFFNLMSSEKIENVDTLLDAMDYTDEGDRDYKREFISRLQKIYNTFLIQKHPQDLNTSKDKKLI